MYRIENLCTLNEHNYKFLYIEYTKLSIENFVHYLKIIVYVECSQLFILFEK